MGCTFQLLLVMIKASIRYHVLTPQPTVIPFNPGPSYTPNLDIDSFTSLPAEAPGRYRSIAEYHSLYLSGQLTPLSVVESLLPLIRRDIDQPSKHSIAFIDCNYDAVLEAATASTLRYKEGKHLSSKLEILRYAGHHWISCDTASYFEHRHRAVLIE
jgi:hypothetical protein